jgi:DNA-binding MarR family transcriptional regulator
MDTLFESLVTKMMRLRLIARRSYVTNYGRAYAVPLAFICRRAEDVPPSITDISRSFSVSMAAATQMVRLLFRRGYVRIGKDPDDARISRVTPTASGRKIAAETEARTKEFFDGLLARIGDEDGKELDRLLGEILDYASDRVEMRKETVR